MVVYECEYMVDSRDIDPWYHCRPSGLMGMLQEAATQAACALHVSRDEMLERYNSFWMLARLWYRLDVPLSWGDTVHIRTWHRGGRGASTYRDFDLFVNGQPVGEAVSTWVLADAATQLEAARMLTYYAADLKDQGVPFTKQAAMAKVFAAEAAHKVVDTSLQIHGGYGYMKEYPIERIYRDQRITELFEGTSQVQKIVIAGQLLH